MEKINVAKKEDLELFSDILNRNIRMLLGNVEEEVIDAFAERVLNKITSLDVYSWDYKDYFINPSRHGYTALSKDGFTSIKMYGLDKAPFPKEYIERIFSHEIWHAILVILNKWYGAYFERKVPYKKNDYKVHNYSGFLECSNSEHIFTPGSMMTDSLVQLLALAVVKKKKDEKYIIDDVFNFGLDDELDSPVDDFLTFFQMFVASFNLSSANWMNINYNKGKGLMDSTIVNSNGIDVPSNVFISSIFSCPIKVMDEFDRFTNKGAYIELLNRIDNVYIKYIEEGIVDTKEFVKIAKKIREFNRNYLSFYMRVSFIRPDQYKTLIKVFDQHYKAFMSELGVHKIMFSKAKFKKIVNNSVKKRIK